MPGVANAQEGWTYKPTKRGGGGLLKLLMWQGPTLLNPAFRRRHQGPVRLAASSTSRSPPGTATATWCPILAAEVPTPKNGGVAADGRSVIWKLKRDVKWHDGRPFTADDVVFNWEYAADPATAATTIGSYKDIKVSRRSTATPCASSSRSPRRTGPTPSSAWRDDHPEAPVRAVQGREVARGAGQPEARRHRLLHVRRLPPGRPGRRQAESRTITSTTGRTSTRSR